MVKEDLGCPHYAAGSGNNLAPHGNCAVLCCASQSALSACMVAVRNGSSSHMLLFLHHEPPVVSSTSDVPVLHSHLLFKSLHALPSAEARAQEWEGSVACASSYTLLGKQRTFHADKVRAPDGRDGPAVAKDVNVWPQRQQPHANALLY